MTIPGAKLISPVIEDSFTAGYNWCVDTIKMSSHAQELHSKQQIINGIYWLSYASYNHGEMYNVQCTAPVERIFFKLCILVI